MKKKIIKIKTLTKKISKSKKKSNLFGMKVSRSKKPVLRRFRLIESLHSFKLIHHKHTAHFPLFLILLIVGLLLFINQSHVVAQEISQTNAVTIRAIVPGDPPAVGASILSPTNNTIYEAIVNSIVVSGTCSLDTVVVVYNNSVSAGSTFCTSEGIFSILIQINIGENALQAMNFDSINQSGPETPIILVTVKQVEVANPIVPIVPVVPVKPKPLPIKDLDNPIVIPEISSTKNLCDGYDGDVGSSAGGPLIVSVVCIVKGLQVKQQSQVGIVVYGGQPPYAVNVNLGDDSLSDDNNILVSISEPGYNVFNIKYQQPGKYLLKVKAKDKAGLLSITQSIVEVNGIVGLNNFASIEDTLAKSSWINTSVPAYLLVLVLTVGFWIGDIFDRRFGEEKPVKRRLKTT